MINAPIPMRHARQGYIFLVSVTVIGVIATATATSLLLLGWAAEQNGYSVTNSAQAFEYAHTCAERVLRELRNDSNYPGDTIVTFDQGNCTIRPIGGAGNERRFICIEGESKESIRRIQIYVDTIFPTTTIQSWQEVSAFSLCN